MRHLKLFVLAFVTGALALPAPPLEASDTTVIEGGGVTVAIGSTGAVTGVSVEGRGLPEGETVGGLFVRDVTGAAEAGTVLLEEGWEDAGGGWEEYAANGQIAFSRSEEDSYSGSWSVLAHLEGGNSRQAGFFLSPPVAVVPGTTLRLQCHWKATRGYLGTDPGSLALQWHAFRTPPPQVLSGLELIPSDASGTILTEGRTHLVTFTGQAPEWKAAGAEWTVPPGVEWVRVAVSAVLDPAYGDEGILVDDVELFPLAANLRRLEGQLTETSEGVNVTGTVGSFALDVNWRRRAGAVEAVVTATATDSSEHAFDLVLALPVDARSWEWLDDWATSRTIVEPVRYAMAATADTGGWLPVSVYPYGGITDATSGIAAAVPLDLPVPSVIQYDAASELFEVCWHLALVPGAGHGSVTVSARFFGFDPAWGFRSIIQRYHDTWREQQSWFRSAFDSSPFESFHRNNYWGEKGARQCAEEEAEKVLSMQYTVPDFVVNQVCQGTETPPDFPGLLSLIQSLGEQGSQCDQYYNTMALNDVSEDATGAPVLKYIGVRPWTNG